jgi:hypothetical protein
MLRAGVGFAAVMKLLVHTSPDITLRYVHVTLTDRPISNGSFNWLAPNPASCSTA